MKQILWVNFTDGSIMEVVGLRIEIENGIEGVTLVPENDARKFVPMEQISGIVYNVREQ